MLGHQQWRLDQLSQLTMGKLRDTTSTIGVLVPEAACRIACPSDLEGIAEGNILTGWVEHQIHALTHLRTHRPDRGDLLGDRCLAPAVDFESRVVHVAALPGEV